MAPSVFLLHGTTLFSCTWHHAGDSWTMAPRWFLVHGTTLISCTMTPRWGFLYHGTLLGILVQLHHAGNSCTWHHAGDSCTMAPRWGFLYHGITLASCTMALRRFLYMTLRCFLEPWHHFLVPCHYVGFSYHGTTLLSCTMYMALRWFLVQYMALDWFLVHGTTLVSCTWHHAAFLYNVHSTTLVSCTVHGTTWFIVHGTTLVSCTMALRWFLVQCTCTLRWFPLPWYYAGFSYMALYAGFKFSALRMFVLR